METILSKRTIRWDCVVPFIAAGVMIACLALGYYVGRASVQSANDLVAAGFTITDPDGYSVREFNDGRAAVADYFADVITAKPAR